MPDHEKVKVVVGEWVAKAEEDLKAAERLLGPGRDSPLGTVCFHLQQCIEKYLKALLVFRNVDFPKTHEIRDLLVMIPDDLPFTISAEQQKRLTSYATAMRYPGDYEPVSAAEARQSLRLCKRIRTWVQTLLPRPLGDPRMERLTGRSKRRRG